MRTAINYNQLDCHLRLGESTSNKNMQKKEQMLNSPVPDQDRTEHLDLVPGHRIAGRLLLLAIPGGGHQDGKKQKINSTDSPNCMCVCVCCVCHHSPLCVK